MKKRVFSGIQPSGEIHLGNYLGAIKNWISLIPEYDAIFSIVDYHAITIPYETTEMQQRIFDAAATFIACGLDPEKCTLFVQSDVPAHTELAWILGSVTKMGDLERMTQYKQKSTQFHQSVCLGLFAYPVLQSADIVLYKAEAVPVGEDQVQHIELCREIVRWFNSRYGNVFPEPKALLSPAKRILGLDGKAKMSKSLGNTISVVEDPASIEKKLKRAVTDPARVRRTDPGNPHICNVFTLHSYFSSEDEIAAIEKDCQTAAIGCIDCKKILAKNIIAEFTPIRERFYELKNQPAFVEEALHKGKERCLRIARDTMQEVKKSMGLLRP